MTENPSLKQGGAPGCFPQGDGIVWKHPQAQSPQAPPARRGQIRGVPFETGKDGQGRGDRGRPECYQSSSPRAPLGRAALEPLQADNDLACVQRILHTLEEKLQNSGEMVVAGKYYRHKGKHV